MTWDRKPEWGQARVMVVLELSLPIEIVGGRLKDYQTEQLVDDSMFARASQSQTQGRI